MLPFTSKHTLTAFEREFSQEIMRSERLRSIILGIMMLLAMLLLLIVPTLLPGLFETIFRGKLQRDRALLLIFFITAYEGMFQYILGRWIKIGRPIPFQVRYSNAAIEMSIPTLIILVFAVPIFGPIYGLTAVPNLLYFLFIILSTLRLDFRLCLYGGIVAAVEYIAVAAFTLQGILSSAADPVLISMPFHVARGVIYLMGGVLAGLVTLQIRRRVASTLHTVEERNRVIGLFGQHVSPAVVERLLIEDMGETGEVRQVCVMFLDIRDFTAFSEQRTPEEVVAYLNALFDDLISIVNQHHGIVNKFLGDGFMAVFGAPLNEGDPSQNGVTAALEIVRHLEKVSTAGTLPPTRIGIGMHAGEAVTGTVGSATRKEYTIIGDVVNLASRIEQLNKQYGSQILISGAVWSAVQDNDLLVSAETLGLVPIRGHKAAVEIYRVI